MQIFGARLASFSHLRIISDPLMIPNVHNGINDKTLFGGLQVRSCLSVCLLVQQIISSPLLQSVVSGSLFVVTPIMG